VHALFAKQQLWNNQEALMVAWQDHLPGIVGNGFYNVPTVDLLEGIAVLVEDGQWKYQPTTTQEY
jgi:hypothetical protein